MPGGKTAWILAVWTTDKNWHIDDIKNKGQGGNLQSEQ